MCALLACVSCVKKETPADESLLGLDYYPTQSGKFVVYDVDSTVYGILPPDTTVYRYRVKEKFSETVTDEQGKNTIRIERFIKKFNPNKAYDSIAWTIKEVWTADANNKHVQVVEANTRFTKLVFPIQDNASWNGNAGNTLGERIYNINYIDRSEQIGGNNLTNVLLVKQREYRTLISYENNVEKYAKGIGLVYREIKNILSNKIVPGVTVEDRIESGLVYKQTLVTYGYE